MKGYQIEDERWEYRPWGKYRTLLLVPGSHKVKELFVNVNGRTSLQSHEFRSEDWIITQGTGELVSDTETIRLTTSSYVNIPVGYIHRLQNTGKEPLIVIEVQKGSYLEEDDIKRYEDDYGRVEE